MSNRVPVLIVGAGAAGTVLALELARRGVAVRLIDRLDGPSVYSRAVTIHARTLELFDRVDPQLAERLLSRGFHCPGYVMRYVDESGNRKVVKPGLDFRHLDSAFPFLLLHSQDETEQTLRDYLAEKHGVVPEWGVTCTSVSQLSSGAEADLEHADGSHETISCDYIVACDGARSRIRQQLGLGQEGTDYAGTVLQNLDIELTGIEDPEHWANYCMGPGHFLMVVAMPGGYHRLLMSQPADKSDTDETPQSVFSDILARHFDGVQFGKSHWHSRWGSVVRLAHTYRSGDIFLAGDAAHVHSTAGGQGMNCCMQDAFNLGWKLAMVISGSANGELLHTYEQERKPVGEQVIAAASGIHELFMTGRSSGPDGLEMLHSQGKLDELVGRVSGLDYVYHSTEKNIGTAVSAGQRLPDLPLGDGTRLYSSIQGTGFSLVAAFPKNQPAPSNAEYMRALKTRYPGVEQVSVPEAPDRLLNEDRQAMLYLVRPDAYVAVVSSEEDHADIFAWLDSFFAGETR